jgi:hypothetical protein
MRMRLQMVLPPDGDPVYYAQALAAAAAALGQLQGMMVACAPSAADVSIETRLDVIL